MKILLGIIFMVSGIIGIARGAVSHAAVQTVSQMTQFYSLPLAPLAGAFLFVGGLMILAKRDVFSSEEPRSLTKDP